MCVVRTSNVVIEWEWQQMSYIPENTVFTLELNELMIIIIRTSHC